jgi:hypothetical protein
MLHRNAGFLIKKLFDILLGKAIPGDGGGMFRAQKEKEFPPRQGVVAPGHSNGMDDRL